MVQIPISRVSLAAYCHIVFQSVSLVFTVPTRCLTLRIYCTNKWNDKKKMPTSDPRKKGQVEGPQFILVTPVKDAIEYLQR